MIRDYLATQYELHPGCNLMPFNRDELLNIFAKLGYKIGVEIGVNNGRFAQKMCERIPGLEYYGIDPYNRYDDFQIGSTRQLEKSYQKTLGKLESFTASIIKTFSVLAYNKFENGSVDFVYIDGNHTFNYVFSDILLWLPKIKPGGVISGHDYVVADQCDVRPAVDFCIKSFQVERWFLCNDTSWFWEVE